MPEGTGLNIRITPKIVVSALILMAWGVLAWCMAEGLGQPRTEAASYIGLLTLLSLSAPLLLLTRSQMPMRRSAGVLSWLALTLAGTLIAGVLTADFDSTAAFGGLLLVYLAAIEAGLSFEGKVFSCRSGGLLTLFCALAILVLPFALDAQLVQSHNAEGVDRLLEAVCVASPTLTLTTCTPTRFRLLKQRRIYERFRIAEQTLPAISLKQTMLLYAGLAAVFGMLSLLTPTRIS